jgi:hypothetical protein
MKNLFIKRLLILLGFVLILISIAIGISIIVFSCKYMAGTWLTFGKYIISMVALGTGGFFIAFTGIIIIYVSTVDDVNDSQES